VATWVALRFVATWVALLWPRGWLFCGHVGGSSFLRFVATWVALLWPRGWLFVLWPPVFVQHRFMASVFRSHVVGSSSRHQCHVRRGRSEPRSPQALFGGRLGTSHVLSRQLWRNFTLIEEFPGRKIIIESFQAPHRAADRGPHRAAGRLTQSEGRIPDLPGSRPGGKPVQVSRAMRPETLRPCRPWHSRRTSRR